MNLFLDTEFTTLQGWPQAGLISIALVSEDGTRSFYAELVNTYDAWECSAFVQDTVLPLLDAPPLPAQLDYQHVYARMDMQQLRLHLPRWLAELQDDEIVIWNDAPDFDWPYFYMVFKHQPWPPGVYSEAMQIEPRSSLEEARYYNCKDQEFRRPGVREHHALDDAKVIAAAWRAMRADMQTATA